MASERGLLQVLSTYHKTRARGILSRCGVRGFTQLLAPGAHRLLSTRILMNDVVAALSTSQMIGEEMNVRLLCMKP